jgi:hypothetical protein
MSVPIPAYFGVDKSYQTIPIGHVGQYNVIVNELGYDFFVLAGISGSEIFSKLVMKNLNITDGRAFDTNINHISSQLPTDRLKIITKNVSAFNTNSTENLNVVVSKFKDIFLKMDVGGPEYLWVLTQSHANLSRFKQMVISFHDVNNNPTKARAVNKINCFKKIIVTHNIASIRSHQNKLTITYIRKNGLTETLHNMNDSKTNIECGDSSSEDNDVHPVFTEFLAGPEDSMSLVVNEVSDVPVVDIIPEPEPEQAALEQADLEQAALEQAAAEKAVLEQAAAEQAALEQAAAEQAALEQAAAEQAAAEKAALEQAAAEQAAAEQAAAEKAALEQAAAEQAAAEQAAAEKAAAEKAALEQAAAEKAALEQAAAEKAALEQAAAEQAAAEQAAAEQAALEQAAAEQAALEQAAAEQQDQTSTIEPVET